MKNKTIFFEKRPEGKLILKETVFEGFENIPDAFIGLFKGENIGKMVVKI